MSNLFGCAKQLCFPVLRTNLRVFVFVILLASMSFFVISGSASGRLSRNKLLVKGVFLKKTTSHRGRHSVVSSGMCYAFLIFGLISVSKTGLKF